MKTILIYIMILYDVAYIKHHMMWYVINNLYLLLETIY